MGHEILPDPDTAEVCSCWKLGFQRTEQREAAAVAPGPAGLKYTNIKSSDLRIAHRGSSLLRDLCVFGWTNSDTLMTGLQRA